MIDRRQRLHFAAARAIEAQEAAAQLKASGQLSYLADDPDCPDMMRLAALAEELGEIARCLHDGEGDLAVELTQLAGIALAWGSVA